MFSLTYVCVYYVLCLVMSGGKICRIVFSHSGNAFFMNLPTTFTQVLRVKKIFQLFSVILSEGRDPHYVCFGSVIQVNLCSNYRCSFLAVPCHLCSQMLIKYLRELSTKGYILFLTNTIVYMNFNLVFEHNILLTMLCLASLKR